MATPRTPTGSVTIQDVAREAGVSRAAVSKVIRNAYGVSPAMRERVTAAIEKLGYRPSVSARGMRGATFTLGIELPEFANSFFTRLIAGATLAATDSSYQLVIAPADLPHQEGYRAIQALVDRQVDGVIAVSPRVEPDWLEEVAASTPVVMVGRHDDSAAYDTVVNDDALGARLVMDHLLGLGHRDIAFLTSIPAQAGKDSRVPQVIRREAYREAMEEAGLGARLRVADAGVGEPAAYRAALELLADPEPPTAVFASHDQPALGVLRAVAEASLNAGDLSVAGYDDIEIAGHPGISLTTVNQDGERMGALAAELLIERIGGRTEPRHEVIVPELVVRSSTRPPRPSATSARLRVLGDG